MQNGPKLLIMERMSTTRRWTMELLLQSKQLRRGNVVERGKSKI